MDRKMEYVELCFNWRLDGDQESGLGEDFDTYTLGEEGVIKITNMTPEGDPGYTGTDFYDVEFDNGDIHTVYNPNFAKQKVISPTSQ